MSGLARGSAVFLVQEADAHPVRATQDATGPSSFHAIVVGVRKELSATTTY